MAEGEGIEPTKAFTPQLFSRQFPRPTGHLPRGSGSWNRTNAFWVRARRPTVGPSHCEFEGWNEHSSRHAESADEASGHAHGDVCLLTPDSSLRLKMANQLTAVCEFSKYWRKGRDSNPRTRGWATWLATRRFKPLSHLSLMAAQTGLEPAVACSTGRRICRYATTPFWHQGQGSNLRVVA